MHRLYKPKPGRFKDYIAIPKTNGYQSLHTSLVGPHGVPVEIQIRTEFMDQMADRGVAAHWAYKQAEGQSTTAQIRAQQWMQNLLELQQSASNATEFIESVKTDLCPDEIYVFTEGGFRVTRTGNLSILLLLCILISVMRVWVRVDSIRIHSAV